MYYVSCIWSWNNLELVGQEWFSDLLQLAHIIFWFASWFCHKFVFFCCYNRIFTCELIYNLYHLLVSTITYCCIKIIHFKEKCFTQRSSRRRLHWKKEEGQSAISFKSFPSHNMIIVITMALIVPPLIKRCIQLVLDSREAKQGWEKTLTHLQEIAFCRKMPNC